MRALTWQLIAPTAEHPYRSRRAWLALGLGLGLGFGLGLGLGLGLEIELCLG